MRDNKHLRLKAFLILMRLPKIVLALTFCYCRSSSIKQLYSLKQELSSKRFAVFKGDDLFRIRQDLHSDFLALRNAYLSFPLSKLSDYPLFNTRFTTQRQYVAGDYFIQGSSIVSHRPSKNSRHWDKGIACSNRFLKALILTTASILPDYPNNYHVQVLLTRHSTSVPFLFVHKDGFNGWLVQYNLDYSTQGIKGGKIQIIDYENKKEKILAERLLSSPLDGYIIDDKRLFHSTTAIDIDPTIIPAPHRLIIILRYDRPGEVSTDVSFKRVPI